MSVAAQLPGDGERSRRAGTRRAVPLSEVLAVIREDYETHARDASKPGFRALLVYRLNAWRLTIPSRPLRLPLTVVLNAAFRWIRNHYGIELHPTATVGKRLRLLHQGTIVIHRYARIGDDCQILHDVTLGAVDGVSPDSGPTLGNGVQVGAGATIIGPVTVGDGARIGPNAVIMTDIPPGATAFAPPARIIHPVPDPADD